MEITTSKISLPNPIVYEWKGELSKKAIGDFVVTLESMKMANEASHISCIDFKTDINGVQKPADLDDFFRNTDPEKKVWEISKEVETKILEISEYHSTALLRCCTIKYNNRQNNRDWNEMYSAPVKAFIDFLPEDLIEDLRKELKLIVSDNVSVINSSIGRVLRRVLFKGESDEYVQFLVSSECKSNKKTGICTITLPQFESSAKGIEKELFEKVNMMIHDYYLDLIKNNKKGNLKEVEDKTTFSFRSCSEIKKEVDAAEAERKKVEKAASKAEKALEKAKDEKSTKTEKSEEEPQESSMDEAALDVFAE